MEDLRLKEKAIKEYIERRSELLEDFGGGSSISAGAVSSTAGTCGSVLAKDFAGQIPEKMLGGYTYNKTWKKRSRKDDRQ